MRYSKQRELVMQTVQALCDHPTAEEIYDAAVKECPGLLGKDQGRRKRLNKTFCMRRKQRRSYAIFQTA